MVGPNTGTRLEVSPAVRSRPPSPLILAGIFLGTILVVVGLWGLNGAAAGNKAKTLDFSLADVSGKMVRLSDYRGRPVLVNMWATWCPPCRAEMPDIIRYYQAHQAEGLVVLAVDTNDDPNAARQFIRDQRMPFTVLFDPDSKVMQLIGSSGLPSTVLIGRDGSVRFGWVGQISPSTLDSRVTPLLSD